MMAATVVAGQSISIAALGVAEPQLSGEVISLAGPQAGHPEHGWTPICRIVSLPV
jgi:hypothetical protein